jgi:hypothetical protein
MKQISQDQVMDLARTLEKAKDPGIDIRDDYFDKIKQKNLN